jgi:ABC-type dipeptide/oligopeptide/nickel transport system permease component
MLRYLTTRIVQGIFTLLLLTAFVFFFIRIMMSGDFASQFVLGLSTQRVAAIRQVLGIENPAMTQYLQWLGGVVRGNLGFSLYGYPILPRIMESFGLTLLIFASGMVIAFGGGQWLGKVSAWRRSGFISDGIAVVAIVFYAFFPPSLVFLIGQLQSVVQKLAHLGSSAAIIPQSISRPVALDVSAGIPIPLRMMLVLIAAVGLTLTLNMQTRRFISRRLPVAVALLMGVALGAAGWFALGFGPEALDALSGTYLAILTFALLTCGEVVILMRTSMVDTLHEDYIFTARAKGLPERTIRDRHAARNALLPVLTKLVISLPYLLTGLVIIESALGLNGMGWQLFSAVSVQDMPVVMGYLLFIGVLSLAARLILEVVTAMLDPRIRFATSGASMSTGSLLPRISLSQAWASITSMSFEFPSLRLPGPADLRLAGARLPVRLSHAWRGLTRNLGIFAHNRLALIGVSLIVVFGLMAVVHSTLLGTLWPTGVYHPEVGYDTDVLPWPARPTLAHLLGTDSTGRDVLSMLMASAKPAFATAAGAALTTGLLSILIGAVSAYYRGVLDALFSNLSNAIVLLPAPVIMVIIGAQFFNEIDAFKFGLLYGVLAGMGSAMVVMRTQALVLMQRPFIDAVRLTGAKGPYIIWQHLIPHLLPLAVVQMMIAITGAIVADGFIAFFGLRGIRLNWGAMVYNAFAWGFLGNSLPWPMIIAPSLALSLFAASFYFIARGLHDASDPRSRQR